MGFDESTFELKTLSLHNYDFENLKVGHQCFTRPPILRVDPHQRCAVLLVFDRDLAVLPFRRSATVTLNDKSISKTLNMHDPNLSWEKRATAPLLASFTTCLSSSTGEKINNVLDIQFLYGFYEPTLLVLYEPIGTWAGRVSARRDTCCIVALSFNLQKRTNPVIWYQESLPFDCHSLQAVPQPIGGAIVLATNSIIYVKQTLPSRGLPLNCYAQVTTNFPLRQDISLCGPLTLENCQTLALSDSQFLISATTGKIYLLSLWLEQTTSTVTDLLLHEIYSTVPASCLTLMDSGFLFIGSLVCDAVLLSFTQSTMMVDKTGKALDESNDKADDVPSDVNSNDTGPNYQESGPMDCDDNSGKESDKNLPYAFEDVDIELYGESIMNPPIMHRALQTYTFELIQRITNLGPMGPLSCGEMPCLAPGNTDPSDETLTSAQSDLLHVELIAPVPRLSEYDQLPSSLLNGALLFAHTSVRPRPLTAFELPEYTSLWSLYGPSISTPAPPVKQQPVSNHSSPPCVIKVEEEETKIVDHSPIIIDSNPGTPLVDEQAVDQSDPIPEHEEEVASTDAPVDQPVMVKSEEPSTSGINESPPTAATDQSLKPKLKPPDGLLHSYLLLTRDDSTMILEVGHELVELQISGFNTTEMTVAAFNIGQVYVDETKNSHSPLVGDFPVDKPKAGRDYPFILQVSPTSLRLLDGPELMEYVQLTLEWRIYATSLADPYVLLCTEEDDLILVRLKREREIDELPEPDSLPRFTGLKRRSIADPSEQGEMTETVFLDVVRPKVDQVSAPACFCLYHDSNGILSRWLRFHKSFSNVQPNNSDQRRNSMSSTRDDPGENAMDQSVDGPGLNDHLTASDEADLFLYGHVVDICKRELPVLEQQPTNYDKFHEHACQEEIEYRQRPAFLDSDEFKSPAHYAFVVFTNGVLEIYSLPEFSLVYAVHNFNDLPSMLFDHLKTQPTTSVNSSSRLVQPEDDNIPPSILEITVFNIGKRLDRPVLVVRTGQEIVLFEAFFTLLSSDASQSFGGILRWRRLALPCPLVAPRRLRCDPKLAELQSVLVNRNNMLRHFSNLDGHRGVFVCGSNPVWLFANDAGQIRIFSHTIDGVIGSFSPLNTHICPSGFVYLTHLNELRLATLPPGYSFNETVGLRWTNLDINPHYVQYHVESKTYAVVGTRSTRSNKICRLNIEGLKEEEELPRPDSCPLPSQDLYYLQIYAPQHIDGQEYTLQLIPNTSLPFDAWEVVTSVVTAQLASEQTIHGTKDYLVIAANLTYGEEIPVRGRILILDLIDVVPEPGQPLSRFKLKTIFSGEQKGPVTALTSCQGHLISAIGQKIYIWSLKNGDLVGVAFVDSDIYIHSMVCVKNLILSSDILKSIQLLRFQPEFRVLSVVSRDSSQPRDVYSANFFVDGRRLGFLLCGEGGNTIIFSYDPLDQASRNGRRLVRRADLQLPCLATSSLRVANQRLRHALTSVAKTAGSNDVDTERHRHSVYLGTSSGALFLLGPIRDKMYSRLRITEKNLIHYLGPVCGVVPRICRPYQSLKPELDQPRGQVADADLLWRFLVLPHSQRLEIARKSGQSLESIMDDIAELNATTSHF